MSKRKTKKTIKELVDNGVSANECTGALQKIHLDPKEVAKFHKQFNKK